MELQEAVKLDEKAQLVKVAKELLKVDDEVTALGWGIAFQQGQPAKLLSVRLNVSEVDPQLGLTYTAVGYNRTPVDTCAGDSGGPLLAWRDGAWLQYATLRGGGYNCVTDRTLGDGAWNSLAAHSAWLQQFLGQQSRLVLSSTAGAAEWHGNQLGEYVEEGTSGGRPYYKQRDDIGKTDNFLYYSGTCSDKWRWLVGPELGKCSAGLRNPEDTATPPVSGWQYFSSSREGWQSDDRSLGLQWTGLQPCSKVEVAARGEAARSQDKSLGSYFPTGSWLEGRPVYSKTEGETHYLRVPEGATDWGVSDELNGEIGFFNSGRGTLSPGDPAAGASVREGVEGWVYWSDGELQDSRGQVTVTCD